MDSLEQQLADALQEGTFDYSRITPDFMTVFLSGYFQFQQEIRSELRADLRTVIAHNADLSETITILRGVDNDEETVQ